MESAWREKDWAQGVLDSTSLGVQIDFILWRCMQSSLEDNLLIWYACDVGVRWEVDEMSIKNYLNLNGSLVGKDGFSRTTNYEESILGVDIRLVQYYTAFIAIEK